MFRSPNRLPSIAVLPVRQFRNPLLPLLLCASLFLFPSCAPFAPTALPDAAGEIPKHFSLYNGNADADTAWWKAFGSEELNRLIGAALAGSFDLKQAWARLQQMRAVAIQAGADRSPDLSAVGSATYSRQRSASTSYRSQGNSDYLLGLSSSYEVDLWGRIHSQHQAALLDEAASLADLQTASVSIAAEVADRWVQLVSQRRQRQLLDEQLKNNLIFLELIELRFSKAMVSALDVYQQKQVVAGVRARIPLVEADIQLLQHEIAVLLGRPPGTDLALTALTMPETGPLPAVGLPADLLANRPDVRAAGMQLESSQWQVATARANRLPALSLAADAQYGANELDLLFDTWLLNLAANLSAPLWDGGRRAAEVDRTAAQMDEDLWAYRQTVLTAVKEVEDALVRETRQREYIGGLNSVMTAARRGLEEAIQRYRRGLSDYLPVLTQLIAVQDLERDILQQQEVLLRYRIGLYRALGGGWIDSTGAVTAAARDAS